MSSEQSRASFHCSASQQSQDHSWARSLSQAFASASASGASHVTVEIRSPLDSVPASQSFVASQTSYRKRSSPTSSSRSCSHADSHSPVSRGRRSHSYHLPLSGVRSLWGMSPARSHGLRSLSRTSSRYGSGSPGDSMCHSRSRHVNEDHPEEPSSLDFVSWLLICALSVSCWKLLPRAKRSVVFGRILKMMISPYLRTFCLLAVLPWTFSLTSTTAFRHLLLVCARKSSGNFSHILVCVAADFTILKGRSW